MDYLFQRGLEDLFNKNQTISRIRGYFVDKGIKSELVKFKIDVEFGLDLLTHMHIQKRANVSTMIGLLHRHFKSLDDCAKALEHAVEVGVVAWNAATAQFVVKFEIDAQTQAEMDKYQYPLPMVIPPRFVTNNRENGYLTTQSSIILKNGNHHNDDVCLEHINRMNRIPLKINMQVATEVKNSWRDIDRPRDDETLEDYQKRVKAFDKYCSSTADVLGFLSGLDCPVYLTHRYDKRGRCYAQGYHLNYQGNPWSKAIVDFYEEEITEL